MKANAPALLEDTLRRRRKPCMIGTGSMSDPYQPIERDLRLTRRYLELIPAVLTDELGPPPVAYNAAKMRATTCKEVAINDG